MAFEGESGGHRPGKAVVSPGEEPRGVLGEVSLVLLWEGGPKGAGGATAHSLPRARLVTHQRLCRRVRWLSPSVSVARVELSSGRWLRLEDRRPREDLA